MELLRRKEHGHRDLKSWDDRGFDEAEEEAKRDQGSITPGDTVEEDNDSPSKDNSRDKRAQG